MIIGIIVALIGIIILILIIERVNSDQFKDFNRRISTIEASEWTPEWMLTTAEKLDTIKKEILLSHIAGKEKLCSWIEEIEESIMGTKNY